MKALVHIGTPKTGTTTLQSFLFANADALAAQGFRYHVDAAHPKPQRELGLAALSEVGDLPASAVARAMYRARTPAEQRATAEPALRALKAFPDRWSEPVALFSAEHIWGFLVSSDSIRAIDRIFSDVFEDVRYLVYLRQPSDLLLSRYSEALKFETDKSLDEFISRIPHDRHFRMSERLRKWVGVVGHDRIRVRLFDKASLVDGDLIADFCSAWGIEPTGLARPSPRNESLTQCAAEVLRALNGPVPYFLPSGERNLARTGLQKRVGELTAKGPKLAYLPQQLDKAEAASRDDIEQVREAFFPDRKRLFCARPRTISEGELLRVRQEAADVLANLYSELLDGRLPPRKGWWRSRAKRALHGPLRAFKHGIVKTA